MAEYQVPTIKFVGTKEAMDTLAESIVRHRDVITVNSEPVQFIDGDERIRTIVREELATLKAEVVEKVINDLGTQMERQLRGSHER